MLTAPARGNSVVHRQQSPTPLQCPRYLMARRWWTTAQQPPFASLASPTSPRQPLRSTGPCRPPGAWGAYWAPRAQRRLPPCSAAFPGVTARACLDVRHAYPRILTAPAPTEVYRSPKPPPARWRAPRASLPSRPIRRSSLQASPRRTSATLPCSALHRCTSVACVLGNMLHKRARRRIRGSPAAAALAAQRRMERSGGLADTFHWRAAACAKRRACWSQTLRSLMN